MTALRNLASKAARLGINWAACKLCGAIGVVIGFLIMAVFMVGKDASLLLIHRLSGGAL